MRGTRGFSLAETLVAALLVSIVLVAAGALFQAVGRQADRQAGRTPAVGGMTDVTLDRLERDLRLATDFPRHSGRLRADSRTLLLTMPDLSVVAWRQEGSVLVRSSEDADGRLRDKKVLDNILALELRRRAAVLFDVSLRRKGEPLRRRTVLLRNASIGPEEGP